MRSRLKLPLRKYLLPCALALGALVFTSCETTPVRSSSRRLPTYEPPIVKRDFQSVRTTAYTHTESDHLEYTNHNALGGRLQAASSPIRRAEYAAKALPVGAGGTDLSPEYERGNSINSSIYLAPRKQKVTKWVKTKHGRKKITVTEYVRPRIGSAAADWSRWPAGTIFRIISTGQVYKVEDYGWALSGRNTIDLYFASRRDMNDWGVRTEPIQILRWGDPQQSLAVLQGRQGYKHIRRMVLELQGQQEEAAALQ
jgi:3D (Asp-Asp-Asp) domain-containing protein